MQETVHRCDRRKDRNDDNLQSKKPSYVLMSCSIIMGHHQGVAWQRNSHNRHQQLNLSSQITKIETTLIKTATRILKQNQQP